MLRKDRAATSLTLTTGGITLLGVLVSVGTSVGLGINEDWWIRVLAGVGTTLLLVVIVKLGTGAGRGPVARLANWVIGSPADGSGTSAGRSSPHGTAAINPGADRRPP